MKNLTDVTDPDTSDTETKTKTDTRFGVIGLFVQFLDNHFATLRPWLQHVIAIVVLILLIVLTMHTLMAPTYVQGRLFIRNDSTSAKSFARNYSLSTADEYQFKTNELGGWILPVNGVIPGRIKVYIHNQEGTGNLGEFVIWEPWPVLSAIRVAKPEIVMKNGNVEVLEEDEIAGLRAGEEHNFVLTRHINTSNLSSHGLSLSVYLDGLGEVSCDDDGWCGTIGESRRLEGFRIKRLNIGGNIELLYMANIEGEDTAWLNEGQFCGSREEDKKLQGFAVRLEGADEDMYDVLYQAHESGKGDSRIFKNGEFAGTRGGYGQIEAMRVWIVEK